MGSLLDRWVAEAHAEVLLPSGMWVKWLEPDPEDLIRLRLFPTKLRMAVLSANGDADRAMATFEKLSDDTQEALSTASDLRDGLIAASIRAIRLSPEDEWEEATVTREHLASFPVRDRAALRDLIDQVMTPASVTAVVRYRRGEITQEEAAAIVEASAKEVVPGWESFRDLRRGADAGPAGEDVGPTPIAANRRERRNRRARAG